MIVFYMLGWLAYCATGMPGMRWIMLFKPSQ